MQLFQLERLRTLPPEIKWLAKQQEADTRSLLREEIGVAAVRDPHAPPAAPAAQARRSKARQQLRAPSPGSATCTPGTRNARA